MYDFKILGMTQHEGYVTAEILLHDRDQTKVIAHDLFGSWMVGPPKKGERQREPIALSIDPVILQAERDKHLGAPVEVSVSGLPKPKVPKFKGTPSTTPVTSDRANPPGDWEKAVAEQIDTPDESTTPITFNEADPEFFKKETPPAPKRVPRKKPAAAPAPAAGAPKVASPRKRLPRVKQS